MGPHHIRVVTKAITIAWIALFAVGARATNNWENGRAQYQSSSLCVHCHSTNVTVSNAYLAPSPTGATASALQALIDGGMGAPYTSSITTINGGASTVSDIAAYIAKLGNYPTIAISQPAVSFAATAVNASRTQSVRVTNNGVCDNSTSGCSGSNLNITAQVDDTTDYDVSPANCSSIPNTGTNYCDLTVTFHPKSAGNFNSHTLTITHNALGGTSTVTLNGSGVLPNFAITPTANPYSFVAKINSTARQTFTISNSSSVATLNLSSIAVSPSPIYTRVPDPSNPKNCATSVGTADFCTIIVQFAPNTVGGAQAGTLTIGSDAGNVSSPVMVNLVGTGTQATTNPGSAALNFSTVQLGVPKTLPAIVVTNTASDPTATLVFSTDPTSAVARTGVGKDDYSVASTCSTGASVAAGGNCTVTVTFTPTVLGSRPATLTIASDATNSPLVIDLSGSGVALPEPVVTFPAADFPDTVIGATAIQTRQVTILNNRTLDIGYSVANAADFNVQSESCPTHVVPGGGGTCTVTWQFQPQLPGGEALRTANVTFNFTGTGGNTAPSSAIGTLAGRALLPLGAPATLAPNAGVGVPATTSTLLSNRSASALVLASLVFSGAAAGDYSFDATNSCAAGLSLASGTSCALVVRFNPSAGGSRNAALTITHNALGSPQAIALNGSATQGAILLSTFTLTFQNTALNASTQQSITVQNNGTQALNFSAFNFTGPASGDFTRAGDCALGMPLAVGAQCTVAVTFQPTALGARGAALTILSDASNGPATVTLAGSGVPIPAPIATLTPSSLDFGTQTVGNLYPTRAIRLSNTGTADLHTTSVAVQGSGFSTSSTCPATLAPGVGCDIQILFTPLAANADYSGTLRVADDAAGSPHTAPLNGRGSVATLAALTWSPLVAELNLGTVASGTLSTVQTATLLNQGPGGVTLTLLNAVGVDASAFAVTGGSCAVGAALFEGQSCTVQVQFAPVSAGVRHAQLQVASTGSFPPTLTLTGTGLGGPAPGAALSTASLSFSGTRVGAQSLPGELTISSTGSGSLDITAMSVEGPYQVQAKTCSAVPFTLPAGSSCTVVLIFVPQSPGPVSGVLHVTTSATAAPINVALSGQGEAAAELSSGGCTVADVGSRGDPTLPLLVLLAVGVLCKRRNDPKR